MIQFKAVVVAVGGGIATTTETIQFTLIDNVVCIELINCTASERSSRDKRTGGAAVE